MATTKTSDMEDVPVVPFDAQVLVELFAEAADVLHRPGPLDPKFEWAVRAAQVLTDASMVSLVNLRDDYELWASVGGGRGEAVHSVKGAVRLLDEVRVSGRPVHVVARPHATGETSLVVVPVPSVSGTPHAALLLELPEGIPADAAGWVTEGIALHLGTALDNTTTIARLAEMEAARQEVVQRLQEAVRPPMLETTDAELGVHYEPADPGAPIGGDLYDWYVLPDGDIHLAVVDVAGKGVTATKDALAVTHALRILVLEDCALRDLVARADRVLSEAHSTLIATLAVARYTPSTGRLRLVSAGHPPAVLVSPEGTVELLETRGIPIGYPQAGSAEVVERVLEHNQALVLYTDGIIEATRDIIQGLDYLKSAAGDVSAYPARFLARGLVERALAGASRRDDSLALVLRHRILTAPAPAVLGPFHYRFSPSTATVPLARHLLGDWLDYQPVDPRFRDDLLFVATELCANAVMAASGAPRSVELRASIDSDAVVIEVEDDGSGYVLPIGDEPPDPEAEAGRGLFLVQALTDEVVATREGGRTVTRCVKRAAVPPAQTSPRPSERPSS